MPTDARERARRNLFSRNAAARVAPPHGSCLFPHWAM